MSLNTYIVQHTPITTPNGDVIGVNGEVELPADLAENQGNNLKPKTVRNATKPVRKATKAKDNAE